jgi:hypothetical protein
LLTLGGECAWNALQLTRLDLAIQDVQVEASNPDTEGRPFPRIKVHAAQAQLSAAALGWSPESDAIFSASGQVTNAGGDEVAIGAAAIVTLVDTPVQRALVRAHNASAQKLSDAAKALLTERLATLQQQVQQCSTWKATWNGMVARVQGGGAA